jgi:hypothetical protein
MKGAGLLGVMDGWVWWMAGQGGEFFLGTAMIVARWSPP